MLTLIFITQSHPKKSYNWRLGTSFDHSLRQHPPF